MGPNVAADWYRSRTPFDRLAMVQACHAAGDALFAVSLAGSLFFSVSLDAARPRIALYLLLTMAPFALVAPLLGPLSDRLRGGHRAVLILACVGRAFTCWLLVGDLRNLLFYPEAFAVLVLGKTYSVSKNAVVPTLVEDREGLVPANSRLAVVSLAGGAVGGGVGSAVVAQFGAPWALRLAAVVFLGASALGFALPRVQVGPRRSAAEDYEAVHSPVIQLGAWSLGLLRGSVGFVLFLVGFSLRRQGDPAWFYGLVFAASGAGALAGSVLAPRLRRRMDEERMLVGALLLPGVAAMLGVAWFGRVAVLVVPLALGVAATIGRQAFDALLQHHAPVERRGRAFARFESLFQMAWVVGALIPVVSGADARAGFVLLAMALLGGSVVHALSRRSALQIDASLEALRARVFEEPSHGAVDQFGHDVLAHASRLADAGSTRWAVLEAATALDVVVAHALHAEAAGVRDAPGAGLRDVLAASGGEELSDRLDAVASLRRQALSSRVVSDDDAQVAIASVRALVEHLDRSP